MQDQLYAEADIARFISRIAVCTLCVNHNKISRLKPFSSAVCLCLIERRRRDSCRSINVHETFDYRLTLSRSSFASITLQFVPCWIDTEDVLQDIHDHHERRHADHGDDARVGERRGYGLVDLHLRRHDFAMCTGVTLADAFASIASRRRSTNTVIQAFSTTLDSLLASVAFPIVTARAAECAIQPNLTRT